jgi:hypothetical protein
MRDTADSGSGHAGAAPACVGHADGPTTTSALTTPSQPGDGVRGSVIPVGQEPRRQSRREDGNIAAPRAGRRTGRSQAKEQAGGDSNSKALPPLRNPDGFYAYKNRLDEIRVFRKETMRTLKRRAELAVWLAIHGCQHDGRAQISQKTVAKIAGIQSRRHVGDAIRGLQEKGLLEVIVQGRYRPNGADDHGLSSLYRVYPRPEPRLLKTLAAGDEQAAEDGPEGDSDTGSGVGRVGGVRAPK